MNPINTSAPICAQCNLTIHSLQNVPMIHFFALWYAAWKADMSQQSVRMNISPGEKDFPHNDLFVNAGYDICICL